MADLRLDPNRLYSDSTRTSVDPASGYYTVVTIGELAEALGWQQGDLLLSVNDHDLQGLDSVLDAYVAVENLARLTLDVERHGMIVSLTYTIE